MDIMIRQLGAEYKGKKLIFTYTTDSFFDLSIVSAQGGWTIALRLKALVKPEEKRFTDELLSDWLEEPALYGAFVNDQLIGYIETSHEKWNNRLRISNILVEKEWRASGVGGALFAEAEKRAAELGARALVLETQSCNVPAIKFYQRMGMSLVGFDAASYSNQDAERGEVRLELGKALA